MNAIKQFAFHQGQEVKLLNFALKSKTETLQLALNTQKIREIVEFSGVQKLPELNFPFIGVLELRNIPIPVLDLSGFLLKEKTDITEHKYPRIIICEFQQLKIGILVHHSNLITTHANQEIIPLPKALESENQKFFNGMAKIKGSYTYLLDIELILDALKIDMGKPTGTELNVNYQGKRLLLVEDSKLFQKKLLNTFKKVGIDVVLAEDGISGLETLKRENFRFDVIFTDIEMPLMNGIEMCRKIKKIPEAKNIPIIFNTSISNPNLINDITEEKLGEYIVKFDEHLILGAIAKFFN